MDIDPSENEDYSKKTETLRSITTGGPLSSSIAKLSGSSRGIPSEKDFYFYYNFEQFKNPIKEIDETSTAVLQNVGASSKLWGKPMAYPGSSDYDDLDIYDWVVNMNDEVFEKLDASLDEFRSIRKKEEEGSGPKTDMDSESGFQVVQGRKNRKAGVNKSNNEKEVGGVQLATKMKPKVPFHIATIPRPQDEYKIIVNNSNQPFEHVWLQRSDDGSRFIHPLENLSVLDFVDKNIVDVLPVEPNPLERTPFKLVEEVKDLKQLAAKLRKEDEFAVDLEHNQYRSFQGLTCLMQISTRTEDFIIDTLKLRIHIGPYLREVFKDPKKKKVMHGADRDIIWLQRDFGIYVCNLFDTGQASRALKLERNSLEYLLHHFCGVNANKEYQNADWRLRPLPDDMLRYAREDTHYLLYIYDMMRMRLLSASPESESSDALLVEVYKRSYDICMQLYEKELLTDGTFLHIYGLPEADLNAQQLAVVAGLCEWRDVVARAEDESTGYVLPNKTLIEIAKQMPLTASKLRRVVKSRHPYIERNLGSVVSIIRHSIQNAAAFKDAAEQLKERQMERGSEGTLATNASEGLPPEANADNININTSLHATAHSSADASGNSLESIPKYPDQNGSNSTDGHVDANSQMTNTLPEEIGHLDVNTQATVQVLKKPSCAFGALFGSSTKRKLHPDKKEDAKLEKIQSAVNLPFHSFRGSDRPLEPVLQEPPRSFEILHHEESVTKIPISDDVILLGSGSDAEDESVSHGTEAANDVGEIMEDNVGGSAQQMAKGEESVSLSDLSSSFQKCFQPTNQPRKSKQIHKSEGLIHLKPFDYEAAKEVIFGEDPSGKPSPGDDGDNRNRLKKGGDKSSSITGKYHTDAGTKDFPQGRRRQAFPASGNRSATFR